jgi:hypothetical protein
MMVDLAFGLNYSFNFIKKINEQPKKVNSDLGGSNKHLSKEIVKNKIRTIYQLSVSR